METNEERYFQIAAALFDDYVKKTIIDRYYVVDENGAFDDRELGCLAAQMQVNPSNLHHAISLSLGRISKEKIAINFSPEEELKVMIQAAKLRIRQSSVILDNYKRELPRIVKEVNHPQFGLRLTVNEAKAFIKPLFIEVIEEILAPQE